MGRPLFICSLQVIYPQGTDGIQHGDDHDTHVGKDGRPHIGDAHGTQYQAQALDAQRKHDVLVHDPQALAGDADGLGDLQGVVVHQHHVRRLNGGIGAHGTHGDADIGTGQHRGIVDAVAHEGQLAVGVAQQALHLRHLIRRQQLTVYLVHAQFSGHVVGHPPDIAGEHDGLFHARLMEKLGLKAPAVSETGTIVHVAIEGMYAGYLLIADVVKPHSAQAIRGLKDAGVRKTVMLTGDAEPVAKAVSAELGLDEYHAGLLPGDKVDQIETLLAAKRPKENLAFVGDGINDAPVLSRADVGIAMGALGSDAAIEAADVVLMDDDPAKIALAMRIARRTLRIVYQNIVFALAIKFACLVLGAIGMASMWTAIFADVGVMVLAVLNATRALYTKDLAKKNEQ